MNKIVNAMTIDVEDYFQVSNFEDVVSRGDWDKYECRVVKNTEGLLDILAQNNIKATFFVLGWIAEKFPGLVRKIDAAGHEVASHGYSHKLVYNMSKDEFSDDLRRSMGILESIIGKKIIGYRAASCSITKDSLWALDMLKEHGIRYDASIFPVRHDRYGIPSAQRSIHKTDGGMLVEFPFSTLQLLGHNIPVAGGGYFRLYPYGLTRWAIKRINDSGEPAMVYVHPWEFDSGQPRITAGRLKSFRHYVNLGKNEAKFRRLLKDFSFAAIEDILKAKGSIWR